MPKPYFNGHSHTHYSNIRVLDATIKEDQLIDYSLKLNLAGIAITDHEALSSHLKAKKHLAKLRKNAKEEEKEKLNNFKLVLGNEIYLVRNGLNKSNYQKGIDRYWHFILLAKDAIGHEQIRKISSSAWKRSFRQYIERVPTYYSDIEEAIGDDKGHLIASTACLGSLFANLVVSAQQSIEKQIELDNFVQWCQKMFGEDFYIELQPSTQFDQIKYNKLAIKYAKKNNIKITVTTDSHYLSAEDRNIHKAFLNANDGEREVDAFYSSTYIMSWDEILKFMDYIPSETMEEIRLNTLEIMGKCEEYDLTYKQVVPRIPTPENYSCNKLDVSQYPIITKFLESEFSDDKYFMHTVLCKLSEIYQTAGHSKDWLKSRLSRIEIECEEIWLVSERLGERLSAYFTTMAKIIDIAWNTTETVVGPGRGSAYVMMVSYLLGITQADPLDSPVELPHWRFLHREKIELPDIDTDFQATKKDRLINDITKFFEEIGGNVVRIATFGTETSKAAIQTATRGLGYEPELGTYLSSLVPVDRGQVRDLHSCYYGNAEKEQEAVSTFKTEMKNYPDIWEVAQSIEGMISRRGIHAAGILITNDDFTKHNAFMKAPNGALTSQWELHDSEEMGGLKYDLLVTDALDRISVALNLLRLYGYIEWQGSLKETYDYYLSPSKLDYESSEMWQMSAEGKILNLFQFDTAVGGSAIRSIKPTSLLELGQANSLMRLMPEGRDETPIQEFINFKNDIELFYDEINSLSGPQSQKDALLKHLAPLKGVADSQESLMMLVMDPALTNFTVSEANFLRKTIAKKLTRDVDKLKDFLYTKGKDNGVSQEILNYIWNTQAARQMGYSFSLPHVMAYSTIAIQQMNLAYKYPIIFWNTACLIVDSAGIDENESFNDEEEEEDTVQDDEEPDMEDLLDGILEKPKKKIKNANYGRISSAIGKMIGAGISVSLPDINKSDFTFTPDVEQNTIIFGLKGISKINSDLAKEIVRHRPYSSFEDFMTKVKVNKLPAVNLIKAGAFDNLEKKPREQIMKDYIVSVSGPKKKLTMANVPMLEKYGLIPKEFDYERRVFNFNKYLKKNKFKDYYKLDEVALNFYEPNFSIDLLVSQDGVNLIPQKTWDKLYASKITKLKNTLKSDESILNSLNKQLFNEVWEKYASGSISKWEMDSVNFYYHTHEMADVNFKKYDIRNFAEESDNPIIERIITFKNGTKVPIYELWRVAGTVIDKNKLKNTVTLSTPFGVVDVKIYKAQFAKYDKQVFEKQPDGTKKIVEKSWFSRGNKIMFTGIKRDQVFVPKVYKSSSYEYPIQLVDEVLQNGDLKFKRMRGDD